MSDFITNFTEQKGLSGDGIRMGYLTFAGPYTFDPQFYTIHDTLNVTDVPNSVTTSLFTADVGSLSAHGGTTDTSGAIDYVRTAMFTEENLRPGSHRIVILATDGYPTDSSGVETTAATDAAHAATLNLRAEDQVVFVFLKLGNDYPPGFMEDEANYIYDSTF
jgi:hypothetical protein